MKSDIGLIGLAVMGASLVKNMNNKGYTVSVFNNTKARTDLFMESADKDFVIPTYDLKDFVESIKNPKRIFLMIRAGDPVDQVFERLLPYLSEGDIVIDGGNSNYADTVRRCAYAKEKGIIFMGTGVSGGEEGALKGPSMMVGGSLEGWEAVKDILQDIAAKTKDGEACCEYMGDNGAGHFVKMVHNGIEYSDMELISETYSFMKNALHMDNDSMGRAFEEWNKGELDSYLIQITSEILKKKYDDGTYVIDTILDSAGQKGTGKWASITSLDEGVPLNMIADAVYQRFISSYKAERTEASKLFDKTKSDVHVDDDIMDTLAHALYLSKILSYAQGFDLMMRSENEHDWVLDPGKIALTWRNGCIIRSVFLDRIHEAYRNDPKLTNLIFAPFFKEKVKNYIGDLRKICSLCALYGAPAPAFFSALSYFDSLTSEVLPANLIQAQRDYFGAHTFKRTDMDGTFHIKWNESSGDISSSEYNA